MWITLPAVARSVVELSTALVETYCPQDRHKTGQRPRAVKKLNHNGETDFDFPVVFFSTLMAQAPGAPTRSSGAIYF